MALNNTLTSTTQPSGAYPWFPVTRHLFWTASGWANHALILLGQCLLLVSQLTYWLLQGKLHKNQWLKAMAFQATDATAMALILCTCTAIVIALQVAPEMVRQGGEPYVGSLMSLAMVRELAPIMTALGIVAVVSTSYASEWVSLANDEQLDALKAMHVSPERYWLLPWVMATTITAPLITLLGCVASIVIGRWVAHWAAGVGPALYWQGVWQQTSMGDVGWMMLKGVVFGFQAALLACTIGINTPKGSASAVGLATTQTVVACFVVVATTDYLLTWLIYGS
ncbi:MAG: ABC transporter permease [Vampirovibrionales bacterium]